MNKFKLFLAWMSVVSGFLLTACGATGPYPGVPDFVPAGSSEQLKESVALPQLVYRIDDKRYFEVVPLYAGACTNAVLYYIDINNNIRSEVSGWMAGYNLRSSFVIDAENTKYLVAPVIEGNNSCSSGGGCGGSSLPYSIDGGRIWKIAHPSAYGGYKIYMSGDKVYTSGMWAKISELPGDSDTWKDGLLSDFPKPIKPSIDDKFHCIKNGKE